LTLLKNFNFLSHHKIIFVSLQKKIFYLNTLRTMEITIKQQHIRPRAKVIKTEIPEGYMSSEKFSKIFEEKLISAYENFA